MGLVGHHHHHHDHHHHHHHHHQHHVAGTPEQVPLPARYELHCLVEGFQEKMLVWSTFYLWLLVTLSREGSQLSLTDIFCHFQI